MRRRSISRAIANAVLGLDEGHVVDDEHVGLADARQVLRRRLRRRLAVAAAVEGPRAAERAVPRAAAGELDGRAGIEHADEVLVAAPAEVAGGQVIRSRSVEQGRAAARRRGGSPRRAGSRASVVADGLEHARGDDLALAAHDAVDARRRAWSRNSGATNDALWPPTNTKQRGRRRPCVSLARSTTSGHVGQVVHREADRVRARTSSSSRQ